MGSQNEHIVMLPFMAHGHLIPFLALARQIRCRTGFTVTIANTPFNIQYLRSTINFSSSPPEPNICLVELPFSVADYGLPANTENSENLPLDLIGKFFTASTGLKNPVHCLLSDIVAKEGKPPLCVISDVFFGWANEVAKSVGTVNLSFSTGGAYGSLAYISLWLNLPHRQAGSDKFHLPGFPDSCRFHITQLHQFLRNADGSSISIQRAGKQPGISTKSCLEWLDLHSQGSVLYISFGSQNSISPSQMMELAIGLEESSKPFIWVIRPPVGFDRKAEFKAEWLPEGFEELINNRKQGLLVRNWAPQLEILSHKSTGAFLSHCGWNSVLESLSQGVPIIGWPLAAEQAYNSKMLAEEMGVSVELTRLHSNITWKEVKKVVDLVIEPKGKGNDMRNKAMEIRKLMRASATEEGEEIGSSVKALDDLVKTLLSRRRENKPIA
ncbi:hypothetical protein GH714_009713 [Hevea brasiliensis]|uniref:Glycosyltransferase n=1 Tax=Hevea brasiliensis TaxID=3981 RepID=A0A6A6N7W2_HEVBR|nr:hypothetical protein GH714_009713 [Hevea brasiliensis]